MDMLAGYGSDDDNDAPEAPSPKEEHQQQQPAQQQTAAAAVASPHAPAGSSIKLPSPAELLEETAAAGGSRYASGTRCLLRCVDAVRLSRGHCVPAVRSITQPAKRPFTAVTGHSLAKATSQPKASKEHAAARPGVGAKSSMLLPPQLRGRWERRVRTREAQGWLFAPSLLACADANAVRGRAGCAGVLKDVVLGQLCLDGR